MFFFLRWAFVAALLSLSLRLMVFGDDIKPSAINPGLAEVDRLYRLHKFADAEATYQALLRTDSKLIPAQVGLVRALLRQQRIDEALDAVNTALAGQPNSAALLAAKGNVQFRRGEMSDAEMSYLAAQTLDPKEPRAHLGLGRLYRAYSLYRKAYDQFQIAHDIAPEDFEVEVAWVSMLPRRQRLSAMESYLAGPHPGHEDEVKRVTAYLEYLKTADKAIHACRLVSKVEQTETKLEAVSAVDARRLRGIGLSAKINDQNILLQLDTGATGIIVNRRLAEKARLIRISAAYMRGIGDHAVQSGYRAVADHIQIGDLEFQDCVVLVTERPGLDSLIGADVFESYLVDIDLAGMRLKLSALPKRPEDTVAPTALNSDAEDQDAEQEEDHLSEQTAMEQNASLPESLQRLPRDRYIAPQMADWTRVFRFGHELLVPTSVNGWKPMLFLVDTGAVGSVLSTRAGRQVSKVRSEDRVRISGMNGAVNEIYTSKSATLRFGHLEQKKKDIITFDLSAMSRQSGTEVSGILGFEALRLLDVKLDYRDGLADFEYDPINHKR